MKASLKLLTIPLVVGALAFAGCGGSDDSSDDTATDTTTTTEQPATTGAEGDQKAEQMLDLAADPSGALAYVEDTLDAETGEVVIDFTNDSPIPHDVVVDDPDDKEIAKTSVFDGGSEETDAFDVKPGQYYYYCSVPGHEEAGMHGVLTVK